MRGGGQSKTQIVYKCNMNFRTVLPYLDLLVRNGLMARIEGGVPVYKTTPKGAEALRHFRKLEKLIPELREMAEEEHVLS